MAVAIGAGVGAPPGALDANGAGGGVAAADTAPNAGTGAAGSNGFDQQRAQLQAFMGRLRDLDQQIASVFNEMPALQPIAQQMKQLLKKAVQESVKTAPTQTGSADAIPTAGR